MLIQQCDTLTSAHSEALLSMFKMCTCLCLIRAGDVRTAADQGQTLMPVCCSLLDTVTTNYSKR